MPRIGTILLIAAAVTATIGAVAIALVRPAEPAVSVAFDLTDHTGAAVTPRTFAGRHLLVFFGFTNCAQICPTQMGKLTTAMANLDESGHGNRITPLFISVDPERDTPEQVASFLTRFDGRFVGLTGSRPALKEAAASFKSYLHDAPPRGTADYQVLHATTVYIVDPDSRIVGYISGSESADGLAAQVRKTLG